MSAVVSPQLQLLQVQLTSLQRLLDGLAFSLTRLDDTAIATNALSPEVAKRLAALTDRFTKLPDQLAASFMHAHSLTGERYRSFADVLRWACAQQFVSGTVFWTELRALRSQFTHEYSSEPQQAAEMVVLIRAAHSPLQYTVQTYALWCRQHLLGPIATP